MKRLEHCGVLLQKKKEEEGRQQSVFHSEMIISFFWGGWLKDAFKHDALIDCYLPDEKEEE